jgi:Na+/melibiose symporter-like transporter
MSIIPVIFGDISIVLILFYILEEKTIKRIETDLEERCKANGEETATA